jgi:predicted HTH domain antitoxin
MGGGGGSRISSRIVTGGEVMASRLSPEAARPDLKEEVACSLYKKGIFSLGRATEWAGLSIEAFKESLYRRGIPRSSSSLEEVEAMARRSLEVSQRSAKSDATALRPGMNARAKNNAG